MQKAKPRTYREQAVLDKLFIDIIDMVPLRWGEMVLLAEEANITAQTLWNWKYGSTVNPHLRTIIKVAGALGFDVRLVRVKGRPKLRAVS